ncbi:hypothetical protein [Telmatospirillum siberiense]|uniref:Uncharacterized protein n=1 Tax=Telmatospirillum siberiense TaxID=382514 RepID=A0A2N3PS74_9PROT|nr:hypothetical protein [Telmatospirillum siberiense]PKU23255.1 hypothetical protein CWS72_17675 [Telmatospirillum siberiense]
MVIVQGDPSRLRKIAGALSEEERKSKLSSAANIRRDIEETLGTDIVNHDKLVSLAESIWVAVPVAARPKFTAEDWQKAIHDRCTSALVRAEQRLEENKYDDKMFTAKVKILRQTFAAQVIRAMQEVADKYRR